MYGLDKKVLKMKGHDIFFDALRRCMHTNRITRVRALFDLYAHTVAVETTSFEKEQSIAYIHISKTFPKTHFKLLLFPYRLGV